jgi:hypothetical protein
MFFYWKYGAINRVIRYIALAGESNQRGWIASFKIAPKNCDHNFEK